MTISMGLVLYALAVFSFMGSELKVADDLEARRNCKLNRTDSP